MKRESIFKNHPIPSISVLIGLLAVGAGIWRQTTIADVQADASIKEEEANNLADNLRYAQKLDAQYNELKELNAQVHGRLTDPADLAANQQYFYRAEAEAGVKITELRKAATAAKKATKAAYSTISYTVSIEGDFQTALAFLRKLETGNRISRMLSANLNTHVAASSEYEPAPRLTATFEVEFLSLP